MGRWDVDVEDEVFVREGVLEVLVEECLDPQP